MFPLDAYPDLASVFAVPVGLREFRALSAYWPLVWARRNGKLQPLALLGLGVGRTLVSRLDAFPAEAVPLFLKAFPLAAGPRVDARQVAVMIHAVPAGRSPGDGFPAFDPEGRLTPLAQAKSDALWLWQVDTDRTQTLTDALAERGAFEIWPLRFVLPDGEVVNDSLLRVRPGFAASRDYADLLTVHGPAIAAMIEFHLLSRARLNDLVAMLEDRPATAQEGDAR